MRVRAGIMNEDDVLVDHRFWQTRVSPTASGTCSLKTSYKSTRHTLCRPACLALFAEPHALPIDTCLTVRSI